MLLHIATNWSTNLTAQAYHSVYAAWFLDAECLHHLEHIHNALCLAAFSGIDERTEHPTPTHCVTTCSANYMCVCMCTSYVCMCVVCSNKGKNKSDF